MIISENYLDRDTHTHTGDHDNDILTDSKEPRASQKEKTIGPLADRDVQKLRSLPSV